jgi:hypothetical protein
MELINLNFTKPFLETIFNIVDLSKTLEQHFERQVGEAQKLFLVEPKSKKRESKGPGSLGAVVPAAIERSDVNFFPFLLRNKTGKTIEFWTKQVNLRKNISKFSFFDF